MLFHHLLTPPPKKKTLAVVLCPEGIVFGFLGGKAVSCDVIPCTVILFPNQSDETSFHHMSQCCEESHHL
jgi:hypothetical protein